MTQVRLWLGRAYGVKTTGVVIAPATLPIYTVPVRRTTPWVALALVYLMTPGSGELTENVVHLVTTGHTAHAVDDADHHPTGVEHGCSGPYHVCECHGTTSFVVEDASFRVEAATGSLVLAAWFVIDLAADGVATDIFRPPTV